MTQQEFFEGLARACHAGHKEALELTLARFAKAMGLDRRANEWEGLPPQYQEAYLRAAMKACEYWMENHNKVEDAKKS